jgi:hypothetical protein
LVVAFPSFFPADGAGGPVEISLHHLLAHLLVFVGQGFADNAAAADFVVIDDDKAARRRDGLDRVKRDGMSAVQDDFGYIVVLDFVLSLPGSIGFLPIQNRLTLSRSLTFGCG